MIDLIISIIWKYILEHVASTKILSNDIFKEKIKS